MGKVDVDESPTWPQPTVAEAEDSSAGAAGHPGPDGAARRGRMLRRALVSLGVLALVLALALGGGIWFLDHRYGGNIARLGNVFAGLDETSRPAPPTPEATADADPVTFLLVGSDTRAEIAPGELPDARSDAIMIARVAADRQHVQVISIPRDSWVAIPGHGRGKINAAYAYGGPTLLIQTVEQLTGVRIDHYAAIDFGGLIQVTDELGGVDVVVDETTSNGPYTFAKGVNHLDGDQARWYVGQRYGLPGGDFDRVKRQQAYLRSMTDALFSRQAVSSVGALDSTLLTVTGVVAVDDGLSDADLLSLAYSLRGLHSDGLAFFTAPVRGTGSEGAASVVYLDAAAGAQMWSYLDTDSLGRHTAEFTEEALPDVPN